MLPPSSCDQACHPISGDVVFSGASARRAPRRIRRRRCTIIPRIGDPSLECGPRPGAESSIKVDGRRKSSRCESPVQGCAGQSRDPDHVPNSVEGWRHTGIALAFGDDRCVRIHQRTLDGDVRLASRRGASLLRTWGFESGVNEMTSMNQSSSKGLRRRSAHAAKRTAAGAIVEETKHMPSKSAPIAMSDKDSTDIESVRVRPSCCWCRGST